MGKVKRSPKKKNNSKAKNEIKIGPRLRLEPRLNPKTSKPNEKEQFSYTDESFEFLGERNVDEIGYQDAPLFQKLCADIDNTDEETMNFEASTNNWSENDNSDEDNCFTDLVHNDSAKDSKIDGNSENSNSKNSTLGKMNENNSETNIWDKVKFENKEFSFKSKSYTGWTSRELMDLAIGLQSKGFADLNAVAECIKTKKENDIREFLNQRTYERGKRKVPKRGRPANTFNTKAPEIIKTWPNIRKWRRMAYNEMMNHTRRMDFSKPVMEDICKKFYEEEKETTDPEAINVKLIYKYLMDCMGGHVPPQLPPKESALVLDLMREVRTIPIAFDSEDERRFLRNFRTTTKFKPFKIKDEFKKRFKKEAQDTDHSEAGVVAVPEDLFMQLSRHKKSVQSFNPLITPVWILQKEQENLQSHYEESNVYVD